MRPTLSYIKEKFESYNLLIFEGKLPLIRIELSDAKSYLGQVSYKKRRQLNGKVVKSDFCLRISRRLDLPERVIEDTVIHEMIHLFIAVNGLKDSSTHGTLFKRMMANINKRFDREISVSHRLSLEQKEAVVDNTPRYRVIAVTTFYDGRMGFKVLPRVNKSISRFYNGVMKCKEIAEVQLFWCNHPFFNRFPSSSALRVHVMPETEFMGYLEKAEKLGNA